MPTGKVIDLSSDGWGVVKEESGRVTFVPSTWVGDEIEFEIISEGKFRLGKISSWIKKSSAHRESPCPHWGLSKNQCRACEWMNIHYSEQLKAKQKKLEDTLKHFKLSPSLIQPIQHGPEFHYRNRVKLSTANGKLGFQIPMSNQIAEISSCLVAEEWINEEILELKKAPPQKKEIWIQKKSDGEFQQGNSLMNEKMKSSLKRMIAGNTQATLELFSGEGNFSQILIEDSSSLVAYESSQEAIEKFNKNIPSARGEVLDLYSKKSLNELSKNTQATRLFLDPPRSGYKDLAALCEKLPKLREIIYVSCNPTSFSRDLSMLKGWNFVELLSFDLFPQTPHLEVMGKWLRSAE